MFSSAVPSRRLDVDQQVSPRDTAGVAYDVEMANRLREILASEPGVVEKPQVAAAKVTQALSRWS
ncbi:MAG TPA: hypothetical protein VK735_09550 [Pseudonocardia sp.]|uniref:hypothetical protein n=1 Tax=Pseudonocardia sp. TaxID=60912 RepID=UPI002C2C9BD6|nr:hypothetical protein [Pseudonocardia sp.]HTF47680.1 hypothetical protein [Pseudonocardia sp.]